MPGFFSVRNFDRFQHYSGRRPPWIKLYQGLLEDMAYTRLPDASRSHVVGIFLLASRYDNRLPADPEWLGKALLSETPPDLKLLSEAGFIVLDQPLDNASTPQAPRKQKSMPREKSLEEEKYIPPSADAAGVQPADLKSQLFGSCLAWLAERSQRQQSNLRSAVGRWIKDHGEGAVLEAFSAAQRESPVDPIAWISGSLAKGNHNGRHAKVFGKDQSAFRRAGLVAAYRERTGESAGAGAADRPEAADVEA